MKQIAIAVALVVLTACATQTPVQTFNGDVFTVTRQGATGFSSQSDLRGATLNEARAFCEARRERFELVELVEARPPYILGNFPRAEVRFRCVA